MRTAGYYLLIVFAAAVAMCRASAQEQPLSTPVTVELTCETASTVSSQSAAVLGARALELLEPSEYNSHSANWHFPPARRGGSRPTIPGSLQATEGATVCRVPADLPDVAAHLEQ